MDATEQKKLVVKFDHAMHEIYTRALKEAKYHAGYYHKLLSDRGGMGAARYLLRQTEISKGFTELYLKKRLDLTVEALVLQDPWRELFTQKELDTAKERLKSLGFVLEQQ